MKVLSASPVRTVLLVLVLSILPLLSAEAQLSLTDGAENLASQIATAVKEEQKQKIAVLPFRELNGRSNNFGAYLSEDLITRLFQLGNFDIVERAMLDRLLGEMKFGESGLIDPETAKKVGKIAGVDAVVTGTMTELPSSIAVNCRLIDVATGRVFAAAQTRIFKDNDVTTIWKTPAPSMQAVQVGDGSATDTSGPRDGGSRSSGPADSGDRQEGDRPFVTGDYTLTAKSLRIRGATADLELVVKSESDGILHFRISEPYLLDSEGHRLDLQGRDPGGFVGQGVELLPHTTLQSRLSFGADSRRSRVGAIRVGGYGGESERESVLIKGGAFTFAANEVVDGRSGQKIIMKIHETK